MDAVTFAEERLMIGTYPEAARPQGPCLQEWSFRS